MTITNIWMLQLAHVDELKKYFIFMLGYGRADFLYPI